MKYTQYSRKKKGSSAFYIIIALCLIVVGVAAWFGFSSMSDNTAEKNLSSMESQFESEIDQYQSDLDEYVSDTPSYTDNESDSSYDANESGEVKDKNSDQTASAEAQKVKAYSMPVNGEILKDFNTKALQFSATYNDMRIHAAVDIACHEGTLVSAVADGKVQDIENSAEFGKTITIDHGDGLVIKYCGLKNITAEKDTAVRMGDSIGAVGTVPCECADQSHLHIEAYQNGKSISILDFFN